MFDVPAASALHDQPAEASTGPACEGVEVAYALIDAGAGPEDAAALCQQFPRDQGAILAMLARELGNRFVNEVLAALDAAGPTEVVAPAERAVEIDVIEPELVDELEIEPQVAPTPMPGSVPDVADRPELRPPGDLGPLAPQRVQLAAPAIAHAEAYNRRNIASVVRFDRGTGGQFAKRNGELDAQGVADWQHERGLTPDGCVGPLTLQAIDGKTPGPTPTPTPDPRGPLHAEVQRLIIEIAELSHFDGPISCADQDVDAIVAGRVYLWQCRADVQLKALEWIGKYEAAGWGDHPQVEQMRALCRRHPPRPLQITVTDLGLWLAAMWNELATADTEISAEYARARARMMADRQL